MEKESLTEYSIFIVSYYAESGKFSNLFCTRDPELALNQIIQITKAFTQENPGWFEPYLTRVKSEDGNTYFAVWQNSDMSDLLGRFFIDEVPVLPSIPKNLIN